MKEASKVKQTTRQSNTAHPGQSIFLRKMTAAGGIHVHGLMRDAEGRKEDASKVKQTRRQSNTAHPRQSLPYCACLSISLQGDGGEL